jgi:hypothetical protein
LFGQCPGKLPTLLQQKPYSNRSIGPVQHGQKPDVHESCQKPGNLREKRLQMRHVQVGVNFCTTAPVFLESENARIACIALQVMRHATAFGAGIGLHHYQENFRGELEAAPFGVLGPQLGQNTAPSTSLRFLDPGEADNIITPQRCH